MARPRLTGEERAIAATPDRIRAIKSYRDRTGMTLGAVKRIFDEEVPWSPAPALPTAEALIAADAAAVAAFLDWRRDLIAAIDRQIKRGGGGKSYEGDLQLNLPSPFSLHQRVTIGLDCYLLGPSRHYEWQGANLADAVAAARADTDAWIAEADEDA